MDGKAGRGGGAPPAATGNNSASGKRKAKAKRTSAAAQEPVARAAAGGGKNSHATGSGGNKKKPNAAAAVATNAKAEKKVAAVQPVNHQQQQQSDQLGKKKKKKRRLHAGAVAAKAAAKAAEAAAAAAAAASQASSSSKANPTGEKKQQSGAPSTLTKRQKAVQASVAALKATSAITTRSSSHAAAAVVEKQRADSSSLKPAKKKQKLGNQPQQQQQSNAAQPAPKKQQKQKQQKPVQQPPVPRAQDNLPKPKLKTKRKIDEVNQEAVVTATTTPQPQQTIRQPVVKTTDSVSEAKLSVKKPKLVVLNRRTAKVSSEVPVEAAAASILELPALAPNEVIPAAELQHDTKSASSSSSTTATAPAGAAGSHAALVSEPATAMESDTDASSATLATSQSQELSQTTAAPLQARQSVERASLPIDEAVQDVQPASRTVQDLSIVQDPHLLTPDVQATPDAPLVVREEVVITTDEETGAVISAALQNVQAAQTSPTVRHVEIPTPDEQATSDATVVHEETPAICKEEVEAVISEQPQSTEIFSLTSSDSEDSDSETEDEEVEPSEDEEVESCEDERMESYPATASPSPDRSEMVNDWLANSPSPVKDFEADDLFLQPEPELAFATSGNDETEIVTLAATSPGNDDEAEIRTSTDPVEVAPVVEKPRDVVEPSADTLESEETAAEVEHEGKDDASVGELLAAVGQPEPQELKSSRMFKSEFPEPAHENSRVIIEESKHEEPISVPLPAPAALPPIPTQLPRSTTTAPPQPISTEPSYHTFVRSSFALSSVRTPSNIETPSPPPQSEKKRSWGASFGLALSPPEQTPSALSSSQPVSSHMSSALMTSPLSSWFLSKGHANFVQQVSFPPRPVSDRRRRSLSPRKQLSTINNSNQNHTAQATQQGIGSQKEHVEEKRYVESADDEDDEGDQTGSSGNAFLESLALRSNWRTWYGNVDKRDLLDPPLQHVPADVQQAIDTVNQSSDHSALADSFTAAGKNHQTKSSNIELLEAEIRAEKARARAFDQELLLMLRGG